jgi:hypothetical protein
MSYLSLKTQCFWEWILSRSSWCLTHRDIPHHRTPAPILTPNKVYKTNKAPTNNKGCFGFVNIFGALVGFITLLDVFVGFINHAWYWYWFYILFGIGVSFINHTCVGVDFITLFGVGFKNHTSCWCWFYILFGVSFGFMNLSSFVDFINHIWFWFYKLIWYLCWLYKSYLVFVLVL